MMKIKSIVFSNKMKKDLKLANKHGYDISKFNKIVEMICNFEPFPKNIATTH